MRIIAITVLALSVAACTDTPATTSTTTLPGDRSPAYVESVEFLFLESDPVQVQAIVTGSLPTPCHVPAWAWDTVASTAPAIIVYSTVDPEVMCAQVLEPFEQTIPIGSFETGSHVLTVNGQPYPFDI